MNGGPSPYANYSLGDKDRFKQFVTDFVLDRDQGKPDETHREDPVETHLGKEYYNIMHMNSMTTILYQLYLRDKRKLDGYLQPLKDLDTKFPLFMIKTCPNLPEEFGEPWAQTNRFAHVTSNDPLGTYDASKAVW
eukprot:CAMPEP_0194311346 /NCGR_PEP_ID=MMETSP0171-20130528/8298_1 /TAXON_ID=218684 /ORGANISM="Corethron pennatum, Strain L29A3" /LENGTH=134 /DNA_ID=CAMNT_0039065383 /DNA_START=796 /DNA_END=1197 /DNA_ORIENTATION=+